MSDLARSPRVVEFAQARAQRACQIAPDRYIASHLVAELADAWKEHAETGSIANGTVVLQASVIRSVADFLTMDSDRFLTMHGDVTAVANRLHEWESAMVRKFPPPSVRAKDLGMVLRNHVARYLVSRGIEGGALTAWANSLVLDARPSEAIPLDEFSNAERLQLEQACRDIVRNTEDRLSRGDALLRRGRDPREHGWGCLENALWALRFLPYDDSFGTYLAGKRRLLNPATVLDEIDGKFRSGLATQSLLRSIGTLLVPNPDFLLAIRVLLHLQTGWAPEESSVLRVSDVDFGAHSVRVKATKLRAQRVRWYTLESSAEGPWGWKAGDLLRRAQHAMRHARSLAPEESLFWIVPVSSARDRRPGEYPSFLIRAHHFGTLNTLGKLIANQGLSISQPHDMRRIRKTVKSARAALLGTLSGAAGDDHSIEVFRSHYAQTTTVHTIAAQTVLRAQAKVLDRIQRGPTLVKAAAAEVTQTDTNPELGRLANQVVAETETEKQLTLATCRDPYDAPFATDGTLCHASPSMCLQCRNAVVFRDHLPRLVVYREVLCELEKNMPPAVFREVYGQQRINIDTIIAEFPETEVCAARDQGAQLHRPLGQRAEQ